jgi:3-deoxy-7-phosphoheptulonate synthase
MVEVHHQPDKAFSDGAQSIYPEQFVEMMNECSQIAQILHRNIPHGIEVAEAAGATKRDR